MGIIKWDFKLVFLIGDFKRGICKGILKAILNGDYKQGSYMGF